MSGNDKALGLGYTQISMGESSALVNLFSANSNGFHINKLAGGSLTISGTSTAANLGFLYQEPMSFNGFQGNCFIGCVGATITVDVLYFRTTQDT
jgi:hypothetical protein